MLCAALPIQGVRAPSSQRSPAVRLQRHSLSDGRNLAQRSCGSRRFQYLDHSAKVRSPFDRLVSTNSSASASSGGFFDNKLPAGYEGTANQDSTPSGPAQDQPVQEKPTQEKPASRLKLLLTPLSDPVANSRLLALCFAQTLCSVATLIHDTYLPVYLQDVLGMSNQKVSTLTSQTCGILHK